MHHKTAAHPVIWAHRGARSAAPENTLAAAEAARVQDAWGWEIDVQLTRDGQAVLMHDHDLRRTTNITAFPELSPRGDAPVSALTLEQVRRLDAGGWFARQDPFGAIASGEVHAAQAARLAGERVPTLQEALAWSRTCGLRVNVELKDMQGGDDEGLVLRAVEAIRSTEMAGQVLVSSFRRETLAFFRRHCPDVPVGLLLGEKELGVSTDAVLAGLAELGASALHAAWNGLYPGRIREFREAGYDVNVYTVNREEDMRWLAREGATGIITDFPARARAALSARA